MIRGVTEKVFLCAAIVFLLGSFQLTFSQKKISRSGKLLEFEIYKTRNQNVNIQDILSNKVKFIKPYDFQGKTHPKDYFWIKIDFEKELGSISNDSIWYLKTTGFAYASIYLLKDGEITESKFGRFENMLKEIFFLTYSQNGQTYFL